MGTQPNFKKYFFKIHFFLHFHKWNYFFSITWISTSWCLLWGTNSYYDKNVVILHPWLEGVLSETGLGCISRASVTAHALAVLEPCHGQGQSSSCSDKAAPLSTWALLYPQMWHIAIEQIRKWGWIRNLKRILTLLTTTLLLSHPARLKQVRKTEAHWKVCPKQEIKTSYLIFKALQLTALKVSPWPSLLPFSM